MGTIEDVRNMKQEGHSDQEIIESLRSRGVSQKDISDALSQIRIKRAIESPEESQMQPITGGPPVHSQQSEAFQGMQPSMMAPEPEETQAPAPEYPSYPQEYPAAAAQAYPQYPSYPSQEGYQQQYAGYQPAPALSSDTITEISEQVVNEKLSSIKSQIEKVIDLKTTFDAKIDSVDDRLKRIEKIIDRLQLSILQKVGEYTTGMEDLKKELVETQKSFKSLLPETTPAKKKSPAYT